MASFSILLGQSGTDLGTLLPLLQMAAPVPGVPLVYTPAVVVKPTKGAKDSRWRIVWWQFSPVDRKVVRRRQSFDLGSITDRKNREVRGSEWCTSINSLLRLGYVYAPGTLALPAPVPVKKAAPTLGEVWKDFRATKEGLSLGSRANYNGVGDVLLPWAAGRGLSLLRDLTPTRGEEFLDYLRVSYISPRTHRKVQPKTVNNYGFCLKSFQNWLVEKEYLKRKQQPFQSMKKGKTGKSERHRPYTNAQINQILALCDPQMALYFHFLYYTFARPRREVRLLKVQDLRESTIWITQDHDKNGVGRFCDIPPHLRALIEEAGLRDHPAHYYLFALGGKPGLKPVGWGYFYKKLGKLLTTLGMANQNFSLYSWKHTGNINLWAATKDLRAIQKQNGHSTMTMSETYLRGLGLLQNEAALSAFPVMGGAKDGFQVHSLPH